MNLVKVFRNEQPRQPRQQQRQPENARKTPEQQRRELHAKTQARKKATEERERVIKSQDIFFSLHPPKKSNTTHLRKAFFFSSKRKTI